MWLRIAPQGDLELVFFCRKWTYAVCNDTYVFPRFRKWQCILHPAFVSSENVQCLYHSVSQNVSSDHTKYGIATIKSSIPISYNRCTCKIHQPGINLLGWIMSLLSNKWSSWNYFYGHHYLHYSLFPFPHCFTLSFLPHLSLEFHKVAEVIKIWLYCTWSLIVTYILDILKNLFGHQQHI